MNSICSVDTAHEDMIHDSQFDYYSTRLATCSSDRTIKIFDGMYSAASGTGGCIVCYALSSISCLISHMPAFPF